MLKYPDSFNLLRSISLLVKYDLTLRCEARGNASRASSFAHGKRCIKACLRPPVTGSWILYNLKLCRSRLECDRFLVPRLPRTVVADLAVFLIDLLSLFSHF